MFSRLFRLFLSSRKKDHHKLPSQASLQATLVAWQSRFTRREITTSDQGPPRDDKRFHKRGFNNFAFRFVLGITTIVLPLSGCGLKTPLKHPTPEAHQTLPVTIQRNLEAAIATPR